MQQYRFKFCINVVLICSVKSAMCFVYHLEVTFDNSVLSFSYFVHFHTVLRIMWICQFRTIVGMFIMCSVFCTVESQFAKTPRRRGRHTVRLFHQTSITIYMDVMVLWKWSKQDVGREPERNSLVQYCWGLLEVITVETVYSAIFSYICL